MFVVKDLSVFLKGIKEKGYNINCGPQRARSQSNSLVSFLYNIDVDFREALYNQNNYHVYQDNIYEHYYLPRQKFSYRNIHMNISNIKW